MVTQNDMTPEQWDSFIRLYNRQSRESNPPKSFADFSASAQMNGLLDCVMVPCFGMWLGIEKDGYTHS